MRLPLVKILRGKMLRVARTQDVVMIELLKNFDFVLHGGTAVWRIYGGKRFSFDIDIYYKNPKEILRHFTKNFTVVRKKLTPSNVLYLRLRDEEEIELEVSPMFKKVKSVENEFWLVEGGTLIVKTLSPEDLVREKINAFINRKKSRDLYDIYYLIDFCDKDRIRNDLRKLLDNLNSKPADFEGLKDLILIGKSPEFETVLRKVRRYAEA